MAFRPCLSAGLALVSWLLGILDTALIVVVFVVLSSLRDFKDGQQPYIIDSDGTISGVPVDSGRVP